MLPFGSSPDGAGATFRYSHGTALLPSRPVPASEGAGTVPFFLEKMIPRGSSSATFRLKVGVVASVKK